VRQHWINIGLRALFPVAFVCLAAGCRRAPAPGAAEPDVPHVEHFDHDGIRLELTFDPPRVDLRRDMRLTLEITGPSEIDVEIPVLDDRLGGFLLNGQYDDEPVQREGRTRVCRHYRLTPMISEEYRLAPLAIRYTDRSRSPAVRGWFPTRPVVLQTRPLLQDDAGEDVQVDLSPVRVYPAPETLALYSLLAILGLGTIVLAVLLLRRIHRTAKQRRLSARERALKELAVLIAKDLIGQDRTKDFYVELTMIVRRYVERAHAVRAPEQTTEEFLLAVSDDPRFSAEVVRRLRAFLEAADLVKFAAHRPDRPAVDGSIRTAREYIETDSEEEMEED